MIKSRAKVRAKKAKELPKSHNSRSLPRRLGEGLCFSGNMVFRHTNFPHPTLSLRRARDSESTLGEAPGEEAVFGGAFFINGVIPAGQWWADCPIINLIRKSLLYVKIYDFHI
jgi:hypothetical protein